MDASIIGFKIVEEWKVYPTPIQCDLVVYTQLLQLLLSRFHLYQGNPVACGALVQLIPKLTKHVRGRIDKDAMRLKYKGKNNRKPRKTIFKLLPVEVAIVKRALNEELRFIEDCAYLKEGTRSQFYAYLLPLLQELEQNQAPNHLPLGDYLPEVTTP
ncbi:MAG: hypothetical protein ACRBFS_24355 [Aureispira sp.]